MSNKIILDAKNLTIIVSDEIELELKKLIQHDGLERAGCIMGRLYQKSNKLKITHILEAEYKTRNTHYVETKENKLNKEVAKIWKESRGYITYIGDWHTHPEDVPIPSDLDIETSHKKFKEGAFDQNVLIDIIIGREENFIKSFDGQNFYNINIELEFKKEIEDES